MIIVLITLLIFPLEAHAYIDPGTGASFVGSLMPLVAGVIAAVVAFLIKIFWRPLKTFVSHFKKK